MRVSDRLLGRVVAGVLGGDAVVHLYWAAGGVWPAADARELSQAVLNADVPFTPPVLLPLAVVLVAAAAAVRATAERRGGRRVRALCGLVTLAVAVGTAVRGVVGVVWAFGVGVEGEETFRLLDLVLYTPLCLLLAVAAGRLAGLGRRGRGAWLRHGALGAALLLTGGLLYGAYGYAPGEQRGYRPAGAQGAFVETPLARFHYEVSGSGSPVVLLSPGAAWTFAWRPQAEALARTHTVYTVDLPGQGFTELHGAGFTWDLDGMTGAVGEFLDAMHLPRVAMGGNSWSGGWALAYAQRHPERVSRLALLASSGLDERDTWSWEALKIPVLGEALVNLASGRSMAAATVRPLFAHPELATDAVVEAMWAPNTLDDNRRAAYLLERGLDWRETQAAMPRTGQPVLVLWGARDTTLPPAQAARFGRLLPAAEVHVLDGCGHALTLDCPAEVSGLMEGFLHD
ncbi:alpha/beta fold hydrolase [Kitasatospora sp. NPDC051170]|uniref:alpha/beta fold hydrolase n=1 Tax=Kitasatospora sp. NPDC051170 TaxID=3364056 RepID=UPI003799BF11